MIKDITFMVKGMQRDLSISKFNSDYAYEMMNMRLTARENNTLLSVTNEKGTSELVLRDSSNNPITITGNYVGHCVLNEYIVLFTTDNAGNDKIYRFLYKNTYLEGLLLFSGNLSFNTSNPISTIGIFENSDIQKVYWLDGLNQSRVINIVANSTVISSWTNNSFDFVQKLTLKENIIVTRNASGNGSFAPGVIQYAFSYYNKYGQQSNIFYTSPLQYLSFTDRGASADVTVSNSFLLTITNADTSFDYMRIYSIHRTSIDATPTVLNIVDLAVNSSTLNYVDTGTTGSSVAASDLYYIGGEDIVFQTFTHKDNTLFLGNALLKRFLIDDSVRTHLSGGTVTFGTRPLSSFSTPLTGYYPFNNSLSNGDNIKTFKHYEYYRFGVQFQHITGKWSEPVFINDTKVTGVLPSVDNYGNPSLIYGTFSLNNTNGDITNLINNGYIKARPVVVLPTINDKDIIAQGMVCPTVYNLGNRVGNAPFAQSSWFLRPNLQYDISRDVSVVTPSMYNSPWSVISNDGTYNNSGYTDHDINDYGIWSEFRHNKPIPNNYDKNAEIQCLAGVPTYPYSQYTDSDLKLYNSDHQEYFFIDQSILTFHSPDLEFDTEVQNLDMSSLKFRIVGYIPFTSNISDIDIQTSSVGNDSSKLGFYKETIGSSNLSIQGLKSCLGNGYWIDKAYKSTDTDDTHINGFFVYPWHRNGSLNNQGNDTGRTAMLSEKKLSNLKYSAFTKYLPENSIWESYVSDSSTKTGITSVNLFNSDEVSLVKIPAPKYSTLSALNYYGNVNSVLHSSRYTIGNVVNEGTYHINYGVWKDGVHTTVELYPTKNNGYPICVSSLSTTESNLHNIFRGKPVPIAALGTVPDGYIYGTDAVSMKYKSTPHAVFALNYTTDNRERILPITVNSSGQSVNAISAIPSSYHQCWNPNYNPGGTVEYNHSLTLLASGSTMPTPSDSIFDTLLMYTYHNTDLTSGIETYTGTFYIITQPSGVNTWTLYTSTDISLKLKTSDSKYFDMTSINTSTSVANIVLHTSVPSVQDTINVQPDYGYLWLGELYRDNVSNRFGGQTEEAFINNSWIPAGEPVSLQDNSGNTLSSVDLLYYKGDTFFQRYDCLKTYPFTQNDQNSIVEIGSFMCETRINLDARYDRNRGMNSNLTMTPTNFNLFNPVYNQKNNFFNYNGVNHDKLDINYFPNTLTWSTEKTLGSDVDAWTNITMASTLDLDGDKGEITSLNKLNNEIYCFQERGLSDILFNARVQISSSDGVPIQITNGQKVSGKVYLSNTVGCNNRWSIITTASGIYFIDNITNSLYIFNGQTLTSLSDRLGFRQWIGSQETMDNWNPSTMPNFRAFYDKNNNDIYFANNSYCLGYSELLQQFTSFYSYNAVPAIFNLNQNLIAFKNNKLWQINSGDYNSFFGTTQPYYITLIANPYESYDKIFNTVEFRADLKVSDALQTSPMFNQLDVWNEYQSGSTILTNTLGTASNLKEKYRIWRAYVPRDKDTLLGVKGIDRIRNPWAFIKLTNTSPSTYKGELHDINVSFTI